MYDLNEPRLVESIFIELEIPGKCNIVLDSLYRIPNSLEKEFNQIYKKFIDDWDINKELVIGHRSKTWSLKITWI